MSINKKAAIAFIQVIENQVNLIADENWQELNQLSNELPEDDEEITEKIEDWLKSYPSLCEAYKQKLKSMDKSLTEDHNIGPGGAKLNSSQNQSSQSSKELIQNAIKENSPLSNKPNSKSAIA
ncbi:hypothetical protein H6F32_05145 [Anabaena sp. FACHB-1237]|uniref:hypothetical protein n=1 Tax=Anabaena sp. FACHB-1237 TaxID=2692769 RepID=UPI0016819530|nr:hypothetical protein [Anabaena sp. FACHB-1237]MBD2136984.1 hypothetical protein [Anabaena sp. FACHB-1237]